MSQAAFFGARRNHVGALVMALIGLVVLAGAAYAFLGTRSDTTASATIPDVTTASVKQPSGAIGKSSSGLPLPRFVSLKTNRVNVRRGPSSEHQVSWVFTQKGLPVEIIAEFEHWRRVRDSEGAEGWIYQSLLTGRRTALVSPWRKGQAVRMRQEPSKTGASVALVRGGVIGNVSECDGSWCRMIAGNYEGWVEQSQLWGVYPNERIGAK